MVSALSCVPGENGAAQSSNELTIYFVRHGRTIFNQLGRVQGLIDSPLTDAGINQAISVGKGMADIEFVAAYSGYPGRQRQTALLILQQNNNRTPLLTEHTGFNEWSFGGFEGGSNIALWNPIFQQYGYEFDEDWTYYDDVFELIGGDRGFADAIAANDEYGLAERYDDILSRAQAGLDHLIENSLAAGGGNVLVVSSGSQIPTILYILFPELEGEGIDVSNGSVTTVKYANGVFSLISINDTSFRDASY